MKAGTECTAPALPGRTQAGAERAALYHHFTLGCDGASQYLIEETNIMLNEARCHGSEEEDELKFFRDSEVPPEVVALLFEHLREHKITHIWGTYSLCKLTALGWQANASRYIRWLSYDPASAGERERILEDPDFSAHQRLELSILRRRRDESVGGPEHKKWKSRDLARQYRYKSVNDMPPKIAKCARTLREANRVLGYSDDDNAPLAAITLRAHGIRAEGVIMVAADRSEKRRSWFVWRPMRTWVGFEEVLDDYVRRGLLRRSQVAKLTKICNASKHSWQPPRAR